MTSARIACDPIVYTNGFTGQRYLSIVWFVDSLGITHVHMHSEFLSQSEHVTMCHHEDSAGYNPYDHGALPSLMRRQAD